MKSHSNIPPVEPLVHNLSQLIRHARQQVQQSVNTAMVQCYWEMGRLIVEHEQQGETRAAYGKPLLQQLSTKLTQAFGKGFDVTNIRNMRRFYQAFPIRETVSLKLSWSHYNRLSRIDKTEARTWYQQEAIAQCWSVRTLEQQISKLYFERLMANGNANGAVLVDEGEPLSPKDVLRDPYVFGSVARGEETSHSDIDFLVQFPQGYDVFKQRMPLANQLQE